MLDKKSRMAITKSQMSLEQAQNKDLQLIKEESTVGTAQYTSVMQTNARVTAAHNTQTFVTMNQNTETNSPRVYPPNPSLCEKQPLLDIQETAKKEIGENQEYSTTAFVEVRNFQRNYFEGEGSAQTQKMASHTQHSLGEIPKYMNFQSEVEPQSIQKRVAPRNSKLNHFPKAQSLFSPKVSEELPRLTSLLSPITMEQEPTNRHASHSTKRKSTSNKHFHFKHETLFSEEACSSQMSPMTQNKHLVNFEQNATSPVIFSSPVPRLPDDYSNPLTLQTGDIHQRNKKKTKSKLSTQRNHLRNKMSEGTMSTQQIEEISDIAYKRGFSRGQNILHTQSEMSKTEAFITNREFKSVDNYQSTTSSAESPWALKKLVLRMRDLGFEDQRVERAIHFGNAKTVEDVVDCLVQDQDSILHHRFCSLRRVQRENNSWCQFCTASFFGMNNGIHKKEKSKDPYNCKIVPELAAAQEQSILENSKEEESKTNPSAKMSPHFKNRSSLRGSEENSERRTSQQRGAKFETVNMLLDNSSALILGGTTRGETKLNIENNQESTCRSDRSARYMKKANQESVYLYYMQKIIRVNTLLGQFAERVPRSEEFLRSMEQPEPKRDKNQTLQGIEYRLITRERRKYRREAFELLLKTRKRMVSQSSPREPAKKIQPVANISKFSMNKASQNQTKATSRNSNGGQDQNQSRNPRKPYVLKTTKKNEGSKDGVQLFSASQIQDHLGQQNISLDQFPLSGISRPPQRVPKEKGDSFSDNYMSAGYDSSSYFRIDGEGAGDICAICMEPLEKHSMDLNFLLFEAHLPELLYFNKNEEIERERRKEIAALNISVTGQLLDQSLPDQRGQTPKRIDDSIAGSLYIFPAYRKIAGESLSDHGRASESQNQTISYHGSIERSVKKESRVFLFNSTQGAEMPYKTERIKTEIDNPKKLTKIASMTLRRTQNDLNLAHSLPYSHNSLSNTENSIPKFTESSQKQLISRNYSGGKQHTVGEPIPSILNTQLEDIRESIEPSPGHFLQREIKLTDYDNPLRLCPLCIEYKSELILLSCDHAYCKECLQKYFLTTIYTTAGARMTCPKCFSYISQKTVNQVLGGVKNKALVTYSALMTEKEKIREAYSVYCPNPACSYLIQFSDSIRARLKINLHISIECPRCCFNFCARCETGMDNEKYFGCSESIEAQYAYFSKFKHVQLCPECSSPAFKFDKCNHISCQNCQERYCLLCRKVYSTDHFNYFSNTMCLAFLLNLKDREAREAVQLMNLRRANHLQTQDRQSQKLPLWRVLFIFILGTVASPFFALYIFPLIFTLNCYNFLTTPHPLTYKKKCTKSGAGVVSALVFLSILLLSPLTLSLILLALLVFLLIFGVKSCFCCKKKKKEEVIIERNMNSSDGMIISPALQKRINKMGQIV